MEDEYVRPQLLHGRWLLGLVVVAALPTLILWPFLGAGFVSDDVFFGQLYTIRSWSDTLFGLWPHSLGRTSGWRPMALISYALSANTFGGAPESYRLLNYLLHGVSGALLASIVSTLTRNRYAGLVSGLLFAVHPIVHENVLWISGRTYPLAAVFSLALFRWDLGSRARAYWLRHSVGVVLFIAALASYEFAVVLPIVLGMLALVRKERSTSGIASNLAPYVIVLLAYLAFRWLWLTDLAADVMVAARASQWVPGVGQVGTRLLRNSLFFGLRLLAWPWFDRASDITIDFRAVWTTGIVILAAVRLFRVRASRGMAVFWLLWVGVFFAPVATYAGFSDRFGYLSAAGIAGLLGSAAVSRASRPTLAGASIVLVAIATTAALWTVALRAHGRDWVNAGVVAERVIAQTLEKEPGPAEPAELHFVGIPARVGSALVFLTYFPQAVWDRYPDSARRNATFFVSWEPVGDVVSRLQQVPSRRRVSVYEWLPRSQELVLRWTASASPTSIDP